MHVVLGSFFLPEYFHTVILAYGSGPNLRDQKLQQSIDIFYGSYPDVREGLT